MKGLTGKGSRLTGTILRQSIIVTALLLLFSCHGPVPKKIAAGGLYGTIIYDTFIINRDSTDSWGEESLSGFNRKDFINKVFTEVYAGKVTPYDYFTGEIIGLRKIREMEAEGLFSRDKISKIQFEEQWLWDDDKTCMTKQVISMTIAYEVFDHTGRSRGQKPVFKLLFRKPT